MYLCVSVGVSFVGCICICVYTSICGYVGVLCGMCVV